MTATPGVALLLLLARLYATGSEWCGEVRATIKTAVPRPLSWFGSESVQDAVLSGDALVVVTWTKGASRERHLIRSTRGRDETLQSAGMRGTRGNEQIIASGDHWWYGSISMQEGEMATTFVTGDDSGHVATTSGVPAVGLPPYLYVPVRSDQPRALQFGSDGGHTSTIVTEVDASHTLRTWRLPRMNVLNTRVRAELLPDNRIALLMIQEKQLALLLLSNFGVAATPVRDDSPFQFATANDGGGHIAIVTATVVPGGERIEGTVLDPDRPRNAQWRTLSDTARLAGWPTFELRVVPTAGGFVAAWVDRSVERGMKLQACDLRMDGSPVIVADIGEPAETGALGVFFAVQPSGRDVLFFWDSGRDFLVRRMPASITQFAAAERLEAVCNASR
jgi:hypothetical protein